MVLFINFFGHNNRFYKYKLRAVAKSMFSNIKAQIFCLLSIYM